MASRAIPAYEARELCLFGAFFLVGQWQVPQWYACSQLAEGVDEGNQHRKTFARENLGGRLPPARRSVKVILDAMRNSECP